MGGLRLWALEKEWKRGLVLCVTVGFNVFMIFVLGSDCVCFGYRGGMTKLNKS